MLNCINHKMPIYKDCTLLELLLVSTGYLVVMGIFLSLLTWMLWGYFLIGFALTLFSMVHATRFLLGRLQRVKYGKPYGYYQQLFLKKLFEKAWINAYWQSPWVVREGKWSVRRRIKHD